MSQVGNKMRTSNRWESVFLHSSLSSPSWGPRKISCASLCGGSVGPALLCILSRWTQAELMVWVPAGSGLYHSTGESKHNVFLVPLFSHQTWFLEWMDEHICTLVLSESLSVPCCMIVRINCAIIGCPGLASAPKHVSKLTLSLSLSFKMLGRTLIILVHWLG